ncbi:VOC family protein [Dysosmobacter sp.]|uniref:VOC family protein n=1 Tax=Dysosmobacter sp. TaxID=2591382 RepID=UPI003AF0182E
MIKKIDHIGIVVKNLDASILHYEKDLKLSLLRREQNPAFHVDIAFFRCGDVLIELLSPYGPGMNQDFLDKTGGGIHHIAYEVDDLSSMYNEVADTLGHKDRIQPGAGGSSIFFIDAKNLDNVETEFVQFP